MGLIKGLMLRQGVWRNNMYAGRLTS